MRFFAAAALLLVIVGATSCGRAQPLGSIEIQSGAPQPDSEDGNPLGLRS